MAIQLPLTHCGPFREVSVSDRAARQLTQLVHLKSCNLTRHINKVLREGTVSIAAGKVVIRRKEYVYTFTASGYLLTVARRRGQTWTGSQQLDELAAQWD